MITQVKIQNYRGFKEYLLSKLTTVNLLVGKNNSGKSALLESLHFLTSGGDPLVLVNVASRRGEVVFGSRDETPLLDISHFFHGHKLNSKAHFSISTINGLPAVTARIVPLDDLTEAQQNLFDESRSTRPAFGLRIEGGGSDSRGERLLMLSEEGAWLIDQRRGIRRPLLEERREGRPIVFISPDSAEPDSLGSMWNQVLRDKQEAGVRSAMQILEPGLEDIVFQTGEVLYRPYPRSFTGRSGVLVSFSGDSRRVPLGSLGDGMRRLLALSISLIHAQRGYLFVDEVDTGLHYSVMAKMWELVVRTATSAGIQVFATTHSSDCLRGLAVLCKQDPELRDNVSVQRIERNLTESIPFTGPEILDAVEQDIELR